MASRAPSAYNSQWFEWFPCYCCHISPSLALFLGLMLIYSHRTGERSYTCCPSPSFTLPAPSTAAEKSHDAAPFPHHLFFFGFKTPIPTPISPHCLSQTEHRCCSLHDCLYLRAYSTPENTLNSQKLRVSAARTGLCNCHMSQKLIK